MKKITIKQRDIWTTLENITYMTIIYNDNKKFELALAFKTAAEGFYAEFNTQKEAEDTISYILKTLA